MILLYGAGGHATVILDTLKDGGFLVRGIFDDAPRDNNFFGLPVLNKYDPGLFPDDDLVITIGENVTRKQVASRVKHSFGSVVAGTAWVSSSAKAGPGSMILQRVIVQAFSEIGSHVILNTGSQLDHHCLIGDFAHIAPGVILCGDVVVGEGSLVGAGAVVIPGIKIGKWCTIGAGAVVINDVPDRSIVAGNPARNIKPHSR